MKHGRSGATNYSIELRTDSGECYGVGEKVRQRTDIIDLHRVAQRFASRRAPEHVEAGRPAAAKRVTGKFVARQTRPQAHTSRVGCKSELSS